MSDSVLMAIRRKEVELQGRLLEARRTADALVAEAREQAAAIRLEGEAAADIEARQLRAAGLAETQREVEEVRTDSRRRVELLGSRIALLPEMVDTIVGAVAPTDVGTVTPTETDEVAQ